ncbi:hypothetical protein F4782DRAFT_536112 [Xylaria castorea]|nr:hypothetical protein F4782DRAFT_536112 [Xylaria castorea]
MAPAIALPFEVTRTIPQAMTKILASRQATTTVITDGGGSGSSNNLSGGAIAGIVVGSVVGVLVLLWIIRSCGIMGRPGIWGTTYEPDHEKPPPHVSTYHANTPYARRSRSRHSHRSHHHHRHSRSPRPVEVVQPVAYDTRGRSPRAPPAAYRGGRTSYDDRRRSSDARQYRH